MGSVIYKYFNNLSDVQKQQIEKLGDLYNNWNEKINVISRADINQLYVRHILHSLAIAKFNLLNNSQNILDVGTGGGFPGIPLAIFYPEKNFTLIDSIGKKISVATDVYQQLGLKNVVAIKTKSTCFNQKFDTIVSRAVTAFPNFVNQTKNNLLPQNGKIIYLKGGDFQEEIKPFENKIEIFNISDVFGEEFFETKKIIKFDVN